MRLRPVRARQLTSAAGGAEDRQASKLHWQREWQAGEAKEHTWLAVALMASSATAAAASRKAAPCAQGRRA